MNVSRLPACVLLLSSYAFADDGGVRLREVDVHVASHHSERGFNEFNPGLGVRFGSTQHDWFNGVVGFYDNSINRTSIYVGISVETRRVGPFQLRLSAGAVSGYNTPSGLAPIAIPELLVGGPRYGMAIGYVPKVMADIPAVTTFSLYWRF